MSRQAPWLALVCALSLGLIYRFWFLCDDAFITWRFAKNWVDGHGIRYNLGDHTPVEGYSNFLWLVVAAFFEALGVDLTLAMPLVSTCCALGLVVAMAWVMKRHLRLEGIPAALGVASVALSMPFAVWSSGGLATLPFALLTFLFFERAVLDNTARIGVGAALLGVALALVRTEGVAWVGVIGAIGLVVRVRSKDRTGWNLLAVLGAIGVVYAAYTAWRYAHFGTLVSNTALVKVSFSTDTAIRGAKYVSALLLIFVVPGFQLLGSGVALSRHGLRGAAIVALAIGFPAYAVVVGGDYMTSGRLVVPALPFLGLLFAIGLDALRQRFGATLAAGLGAAVVLVGLLPAWGYQPLLPKSLHQSLHVRTNTSILRSEYKQWVYMKRNAKVWRRQGEAIAHVAPAGASMEHATIGAVGYYSGVFIYDLAGLVTREVAERPLTLAGKRRSPGHEKTVPRNYFAKDNPTYLRAIRVNGKRFRTAIPRVVRGFGIPRTLRSRYVPDFYPVPDPEQLAFLVVIRRLEAGEDSDLMWSGLDQRLREYEPDHVTQEGTKAAERG